MWTTRFWKRATERAAKTAAQFGLLALGTVVFTSVGEVVNAAEAVGFALLFGAVSSYLTSIASTAVGDHDSPSLMKEHGDVS